MTVLPYHPIGYDQVVSAAAFRPEMAEGQVFTDVARALVYGSVSAT